METNMNKGEEANKDKDPFEGKSRVKYDEVLSVLGEFGRYQKLQYALVCFVSITSSWHSMNMVFVGPTPDHNCQVNNQPKQWMNLTRDQYMRVAYPAESGSSSNPNKCLMYNVSDIDWTQGDYETWMNESRTTHDCVNGWAYSQEHYRTTIVSEWNLVCDRRSERSMASTIFFAGRLAGAFFVGPISDKFGRRPVFFISLVCQIIVGIAAAFSPELWFFYIFYFLQGAFQVAVYLSSYVLGTEVVGPSHRKTAGMLVNYFYAIGQMMLAGLGYGLREWRAIELTISCIPAIFFIYWWILPESIRWLLAHGRKEAADKILRKSADVNKVQLPADIIERIEIVVQDTGKTYTFIDLLKRWSLAKISLNIWFNWMVNALVYYGLNLNTSNLAGDPYLNFFIAGCVEIPGLIVSMFLLDRVGRRPCMLGFMLLAGVACIATAFVTDIENARWLPTALSMVGKFAITASYAIIYLMAAEVFPTVARNVGMGMASVLARVGGMVAPQFLLMGDLWKPLPLLTFGILSILGGGMSMLLPETMGKPLPQDIEEMEVQFQTKNDNTHVDDVEKENLAGNKMNMDVNPAFVQSGSTIGDMHNTDMDNNTTRL